VTSIRDKDVGGLDVEVEDVARMHVGDSSSEFGQDLPDSCFVELLVLSSIFFEPIREVSGGTEFSLNEEVSGLLPSVDKGDEMRRRILFACEESKDVDFFETTKTEETYSNQFRRNYSNVNEADLPIFDSRERMFRPFHRKHFSFSRMVRNLESVAELSIPEIS